MTNISTLLGDSTGQKITSVCAGILMIVLYIFFFWNLIDSGITSATLKFSALLLSVTGLVVMSIRDASAKEQV